MDPLGNIQPITPVQAPAPVVQPVSAAPVPTTQAAAAVTDQVVISPQAAAQQAQAVQHKEQIANPEVLGTGSQVTFFVGGKIYARETKIVDGLPHFTYVPQDPVNITA